MGCSIGISGSGIGFADGVGSGCVGVTACGCSMGVGEDDGIGSGVEDGGEGSGVTDGFGFAGANGVVEGEGLGDG